mgnify:CR=1 FL=1
MSIGAALTADIVNSTILSPRLHQTLISSISSILKPSKLEFYRGDSFQALIVKPEGALKEALQVRLAAKKIGIAHDVRISIGIGEVRAGLKNLSISNDEAFVISGRNFDQLAKTNSRLIISCSDNAVNHGLRTISYFVDYLFKDLSTRQAEVFSELLKDHTQTEVSQILKKSQSTISKHVQAGGWNELLKILDEYQNLISII